MRFHETRWPVPERGWLTAFLVAACMLFFAVQTEGHVLASSSDNNAGRQLLQGRRFKQITDDNVFNRAVAAVLDRLSIPNWGGQFWSAVDGRTAISSICQKQDWQGVCLEEAAELRTQAVSGLNFKYNPEDQRLSTIQSELGPPPHIACMHIWDGQQDAPNRDRYKAYVALCDKDWASRGDTLRFNLRFQRRAIVEFRAPTFQVESVSKPGFCRRTACDRLSRNTQDASEME